MTSIVNMATFFRTFLSERARLEALALPIVDIVNIVIMVAKLAPAEIVLNFRPNQAFGL